MGKVVNKSFNKIQRNIANKSDKLLTLLQEHNGTLYGEWTKKQYNIYEKLYAACESIIEEISDIDEIDSVPEFEKDK